MLVAPALPSTAVVAVHVNALNCALMTMGWLLVSVAPHRLAAYVKAIRRCWPSVVPVLPPIGVAGVVSLKPTPAALMLLMTMVAAAWAWPATANVPASASAATRRLLDVMLMLLAGLGGDARALF